MIVHQQLQMIQRAEQSAKKSKCEIHVGAAIRLKNGRIITAQNQPDPAGGLDHHAEEVLLKKLEQLGMDLTGAVLFVTRRPCVVCTELLVQHQLGAVYYRDHQPEMRHLLKLSAKGIHLDGMWSVGTLIRRQWWLRRSDGLTLPPQS